MYLKRAENEIKLAGILFRISESPELQKKVFDIADPETYFSAVISHSYYAIFYSSKAYLLGKGIEIKAPEEHRKAYEEFSKFIDAGKVDMELLEIYRKALIRAESLLGIFREEKRKRGEFTYRTMPQANREPAEESIENSKTFFRHIFSLCSEKRR